jgi:beta-glucosidase
MKIDRLPLIIFLLFSTSYLFPQKNANPENIFEIQAEKIISKMTLEEKASQMLNASIALYDYGLDEYNWWNESLHGVARAGKATVFPQAIALAATFDADLIENVASAISDEARAMYNISQKRGMKGQYSGLTFWSPNVNIFRDARWGRGQETYGEDPFLSGLIGSAFVRGLQGSDPNYLKVAACAKHFAVHSGPEADRHHFNAVVSKQDLYETYLPAFKTLVEANVEIVMCAYNKLNDEPCCGSNDLLSGILRKDWGFKGHVVSDCGAINDIKSNHKFTLTDEQSVAYAINGGVDLNCGNLYMKIPSAVKKGLLSEKDVDKSLKRLLVTRYKLGMFEEKGSGPYDYLDSEHINSQENKELAYMAASKSIVLLKNANSVLPLSKKLNTIFVTGPNAANIDMAIGNYNGLSSEIITPLEGIVSKVDYGVAVKYRLGVELNNPKPNPSFSMMHLASSSDATIAFMGISALIEGEEGDAILSSANGDRVEISLPKNQIKYIKELRKRTINKPLILVVSSGSAIDLSDVEELVDAIIYCWYPGEQGGRAIAEILFGDVNPSGKLPITLPKSINQLPDYADYSMDNRTYKYLRDKPMYPFGYGLSYSNIKYSEISMFSTIFTDDKENEAQVTITNMSDYKTEEVVQLYVSDLDANFRVPNSSLKGVKRIKLNPREIKKVTFKINKEMLQFVDYEGNSVFDPGLFEISIGNSSPGLRSLELGANISTLNFTVN